MRIAIDFDDTIMDYTTGEMIPGADKALQEIRNQGHKIVIYTANWITHKGLLKGWLKAYNIPYDDIYMNKPTCEMLIDDRAIKFTGWKDFLDEFRKK